MLKSVEGVYRQGKVELAESPTDIRDDTRVIVTFLDSSANEMEALGIDQTQAAELRSQLASFGEEWDSPEMDIYDDYDSAKTQL
jgi:hypothetical protein